METKYLHFNGTDLALAGKLIRQGELVAFPTETVYGLGANAYDSQAVAKTYAAKGRPSDNPLIVHVWDKSQIYDIAREVNTDAEKVISTLMPNSLTIVLPKKDTISDSITAGLDTVAIRMPSSVQAREFLRAAQVPVTAPSANVSGRPSPTNWQRVRDDMDGRISAILCGDDCEVGIESTVLDLSHGAPKILRPGAVTAEELTRVLGKRVETVTDPKAKVNSPGVRYKHYAPKVPMVLDLSGDCAKLIAYYDQKVAEGYNPVLWIHSHESFELRNVHEMGFDAQDVAKGLYENLRNLETKYDFIIASFNYNRDSFDGDVSAGIVDRLKRAAGHNII